MRNSLLITLCLFAIHFANAQEQTLLRGAVTETTVTNDSLDISYSIYLPQNYDPEKLAKALFVFDPEGEGTKAARLFASGLQGEDFVIVSNNHPMSSTIDSLDACKGQRASFFRCSRRTVSLRIERLCGLPHRCLRSSALPSDRLEAVAMLFHRLLHFFFQSQLSFGKFLKFLFSSQVFHRFALNRPFALQCLLNKLSCIPQVSCLLK